MQANIVARQVQRISKVDLCFIDAVGVETRTLVELEVGSTRGAARVRAFVMPPMQNRATMRDMGEGRRGDLQNFVLARR